VNLAAGRTDKAVEILERERVANPDTINARIPLAAIYEGKGRHDEAREVVEEILTVNPHLTTATMIPLAPFFTADKAREFKENLRKAGLPDKAPDTRDFKVPGFGEAPAIAVLPFDNLSGNPDQEYFADGIAEDLITRLSTWGTFPVIARNSSFTYKGAPVDVKQVGQELGARYVVEGSVRKAADRIRIAAQLIDAGTDRHVWAETYDRDLRDIFAVQDEITEAIVAGMGTGLLLSETTRAMRKNTQDLSAYDFRMRGLWHHWKYTKEDNARARTFFEKAIELNAGDAVSLGGLAMAHYFNVLYGWSDSPARALEEQFRTAQRCAELDETLPACQVPLGLAYALRDRREEAIGAVTLAVESNPSNTFARGALCYFLGVTGAPDEGIGHCDTALRLNPQGPAVWMTLHIVALGHFGAGRYEKAVQWEQRSLRRRRHYWVAHGTLAASQAYLGQMDEARAALREMVKHNAQVSADGIRRIFTPAHDEYIDRWIEGLRKAGWEG
jgi:TolB-like protein